MSDHVVPVSTYVAVFLALIVLTAVTVAVAFVELGALNDLVAMAIAVTKSVLVILYFMHVRYSGRLTGLVVVSGFLWLLILLAFTLSDYLSRGLLDVPGK